MIYSGGVFWVDLYNRNDWCIGIQSFDVIAGSKWEIWHVYSEIGRLMHSGALAPDVKRIAIDPPNPGDAEAQEGGNG